MSHVITPDTAAPAQIQVDVKDPAAWLLFTLQKQLPLMVNDCRVCMTSSKRGTSADGNGQEPKPGEITLELPDDFVKSLQGSPEDAVQDVLICVIDGGVRRALANPSRIVTPDGMPHA